ncbi:MAG: transcriptional regulator, AraC family [Bacteroidetes bacterium]|nr:transcriptional regulator, AraC family [Bacteroidota bacterium]
MPYLPPTKETHLRLCEFLGDVNPAHLRGVDYYMSEDVVMLMSLGAPCPVAAQPFHSHPAHLFVFCFTGTNTVVMPHYHYRASAGQLLHLPPGSLHHALHESPAPQDVAVFIRPSFLQRLTETYASHSPDLQNWSCFEPTCDLLFAVKRFIAEGKQWQCSNCNMLHALGLEVAHLLLRSMLCLKGCFSDHYGRNEINCAVAYMWHHLAEKLPMNLLASCAGMSTPNFNRVFRKETGFSPNDYLIEIRLETACRLLLAGSLSLQEIAMDCGFSSLAHFSSSFQKKYRLSPSSYLVASLPK